MTNPATRLPSSAGTWARYARMAGARENAWTGEPNRTASYFLGSGAVFSFKGCPGSASTRSTATVWPARARASFSRSATERVFPVCE